MRIRTTINGGVYEREVDESKTLLRFLREDLGLTGTKEGCGAGECGACTVLLEGKAVNSCLVLAVEADGAEIRTIEGESSGGRLSAIQEAFVRNHAIQCGYCSPGMIMSVRALIDRNPKPSVEEVKEGIEGNLCRCTGYAQIVEAVLDVTGQLGEANKGRLEHA
jgi:carbon-monoxide dehydrogenase small subunit